MTIQEALQNVDIIVADTRMKRNEHVALQQSIDLLTQRCKLADELERIISEQKEEKKCPSQPVD